MKIKGFSLLNLRRTRVGKNKKKRGMLRRIYSFFRIKTSAISLQKLQISFYIFNFCSIFEQHFRFCSIFEQKSSLWIFNPTKSHFFHPLSPCFFSTRRRKRTSKLKWWNPSGDSNSSRWMKTCRSSKIQLLYPHPSWTFQATRKTTPPCWRLALQFGSLTWRTG